MKNLILAAVIIFIIAGCTTQPISQPKLSTSVNELREKIEQVFYDTLFRNAYWGVKIQSLASGEVIYTQNEKKMFMPASNMKLLTSAAAFVTLSSEYCYYTQLVTNGFIKDSTLFGDVVLIGSGDPTISGRYNNGKVTQTFESWADSLKLLGIKEIRGRLIGDDNCFDEEYYGHGWSADDETGYDAAQISGVSFNDNCVDFTIVPSSRVGDTCRIVWLPNTKYITVINKTITAPPTDSLDEISFFRERGTNTILIEKRLSQNGRSHNESVAIDNPTLYTMFILKEVFESKGILVKGSPVDIDDLNENISSSYYKRLASFVSLPYSKIINTINKSSQNFYAEQIFRTISKEKTGRGSVDSTLAIIKPIFSSWGIDTSALRMVDGSGLSRLNLVTTSDIVSVLCGMYKEKNFLTFYESLPVAGVDGTLKRRMKKTKAEGNVHAKTGQVGYVRSLSGYVTSVDGEMFVFSMIVNNYTVPTKYAENIQDKICVLLAEYSRSRNNTSLSRN